MKYYDAKTNTEEELKLSVIDKKAPMNIELFKIYLPLSEKLLAFFGEEIVKKVLKNYTLRDFVDEEKVRESDIGFIINFACRKKYKVKSDKPTFENIEEWKGDGWHRTIQIKAYIFFIPTRYGKEKSKFFRDLLFEKFPYLKNFNWGIYFPDFNEKWQIYLHVKGNESKENGSIYVPIEALVKNDTSLIIKNHCDYFNKYYGNDEERLRYKTQAISLLESKEMKELTEILDKLRKEG